MTIHGSHFHQFLPFASLGSIISGRRHGNRVFLKIKKKSQVWYYDRQFFCKKQENENSSW